MNNSDIHKYPRGVVYSAIGKDYIYELIRSAKSLKKHHPHLKVSAHVNIPHLINNRPKIKQLFHQVIEIPSRPPTKSQQTWGRYQKVVAMSQSPYKVTLYLDVDTRIKRSIHRLFEKLNPNKKHPKPYDLAIANSPKLTSNPPFRLLKYKKPNRYNSGVIVYNSDSPKIKQVFQIWIKDCENNKSRKLDDQAFLVDIINRKKIHNLQVRVIDNRTYNARHTMIDRLKIDDMYDKVKILHRSI